MERSPPKIANIRHQALVDDLERIRYRISHHQSDDHIKIQLIENVPTILGHPKILAEKMAAYMTFITNLNSFLSQRHPQ